MKTTVFQDEKSAKKRNNHRIMSPAFKQAVSVWQQPDKSYFSGRSDTGLYYSYPFQHLRMTPLAGCYTPYRHLQPKISSHSTSLRPYPPVNPALFKQSAQSIGQLLREMNLLLNRLSDNSDFAFRLMTAAQAANRKEVERLVRSAGILRKANISFNPDSFRIELRTSAANVECCKLAVALRWR